MDTTVADSLIGTIIDGRYRVQARLARGGMATVYTAMDDRLERTVALKIIHPTRAGEPRFLERFTDEAKVIARLTHPNVVAVYDQGTHQGLPYLVMEYVRGRTLREVLAEQRRLSPDEALTILEQMLAAIAAAHRAGLVHRDVKPENVLVAEAPNHSLLDSVVKVADFGLARAVEEASADGAPTGGQLLATVAYVAPELVTDNHADPRTDVYSAGVVLFEMLTGRVPYEAERPVEVAWQHVDRDIPPPSRYVPGLPPALDDLVTRATRRDPGGRPTDAGAMLAEVQDARDDIQPPAPARPRPESAPTVMVPQVEADTTVQGKRFTTDPVTAGTVDTVVQGQRYDVDATVHMARAEDRPQWARLPSARPEPRAGARAGARRRPAEHHQGGGGLRHVKELVLSHPQGRLAVAAALVVLGLLVAIGGWWFGVGRFTDAPGLVTMQRAGAVSLAKQDGFKLKFDAGRYDEKIPKDTVLAQNPAAGARIVSGGTITLTLSKGPERYALPDESGKDADLAQNDLRQLRLAVKVVQVYDDVVPAGVVSGTDPAAQTEVKPGATITLKVSQRQGAGDRATRGQPAARPGAGPARRARPQRQRQAAGQRQAGQHGDQPGSGRRVRGGEGRHGHADGQQGPARGRGAGRHQPQRGRGAPDPRRPGPPGDRDRRRHGPDPEPGRRLAGGAGYQRRVVVLLKPRSRIGGHASVAGGLARAGLPYRRPDRGGRGPGVRVQLARLGAGRRRPGAGRGVPGRLRRSRRRRVRARLTAGQPRLADPRDGRAVGRRRWPTRCAGPPRSAPGAWCSTPGARSTRGTRRGASTRYRAALLPLLDTAAAEGLPKLLVEPSAGGGRSLAARVEHLGPYLDAVDRHPWLGVCFDTCHAWAAGHDLASRGRNDRDAGRAGRHGRRGPAVAGARQRLQGPVRLDPGPARVDRQGHDRRSRVRAS